MSALINIAIGVFSGVITTFFLWVATGLYKKTTARRRWDLQKPDQLHVFVSSSGAVSTGDYSRPTTGIGQAKALAIISPSLTRGWRSIDLQNVLLSSEFHGRDLESDLILLGGPKTNQVTKQALEKIAERFGANQVESTITAGNETFSGVMNEANEVVTDYGLVIRTSNPFVESTQRRLVILSGCHTFGTIGAARFMVESKLPKGDFAVVIKTTVKGDHALPPAEVWRSHGS